MTNTKVSIATIITCHNRKEKTLTCLKNLNNQDGIDDVNLIVYLVDDGSSDGTGDAVKQKFPQVNILEGNGTLYWNGGMRLAFSEAMKNDYDYYLWLNDDTFLYSDAVKLLLETSKNMKQKIGGDVIATGTIKDIETGEVFYGGRNQKSKLQPLKFILLENSIESQQCDTFNGNVVLIPRNVTKEIRNISSEFSKQHGGDFDYGLRAKYAGFESWVAPGFIGRCSSNPIEGTIFDIRLSLKERRKKMNTPRGVPPAKEWMIFAKRHAGILWPIYWLRTIVRVLFPWTYLYLRKPQW
jgi:GT2 family glycosyltransferase